MTDPKVVAGAVLMAFAAWQLWPKLRGAIGKVGSAIPIITSGKDPAALAAEQAVEDFRAFQKVVSRAERIKSPEAAEYLRAAIPLLFGAAIPPAAATKDML